MRSALDVNTRGALYEQARWRACGFRRAPTGARPTTLSETIEWARRIPRSAREAQGYTRMVNFARHVKRLRAERARLREREPDPLRRDILDKLDRILADRPDLFIAARRAAKCWWRPQMNVWWSHGKPQVHDSVRLIRGRYYEKRDVVVPAPWLLARLGEDETNIAIRVQRADPRPRILSTPHWIDRVAAGALKCHPSWLTATEHAVVDARAKLIRPLQWERRRRKPHPELRIGDIEVGPSSPFADCFSLRLSGKWAHTWPIWPTRAEIVAKVRETRKRWEEQQKRHAAPQRIRERMAPDPDAPDTLGWRGWIWDGSVLISPLQRTAWHDITLQAGHWEESTVLRGTAGIHARRLPRDWRRADPAVTEIGRCDIHGIVERFGRYVLGTEGWRAEWVVIRELMAPDTETALALMRKYPDVRVHVMEQEASNEDR
jgi:hypothetical protein